MILLKLDFFATQENVIDSDYSKLKKQPASKTKLWKNTEGRYYLTKCVSSTGQHSASQRHLPNVTLSTTVSDFERGKPACERYNCKKRLQMKGVSSLRKKTWSKTLFTRSLWQKKSLYTFAGEICVVVIKGSLSVAT